MQNANRQPVCQAPAQSNGFGVQRKTSRYPFYEIKFMRWNVWDECQKHVRLLGSTAVGNQIFQRYRISFVAAVSMDFCCRGKKLRPASAAAFAELLSRTRVVSARDLDGIREVMSEHWQDPSHPENNIIHAEVGNLNGNHVLAIEWADARRNLKWISVYLDGYGDGKTVREIHFCAPAVSFDGAKKHFNDVLRSIQWNLRSERSVGAVDGNVVYMAAL